MLKGEDNINNKNSYKVCSVCLSGQFGGALGQGGVRVGSSGLAGSVGCEPSWGLDSGEGGAVLSIFI